MSEIDVSKCRFYEFDGICGSPINKNELECNKITNEMCYYKQLQQLKAENEELKNKNQKMYKMGCKNFVAIEQAKRLYKINKCLDEIEEIVKDICDEECDFKWCKGKKHCGDDDCRYMQIMQKIKEVKGNEKHR